MEVQGTIKVIGETQTFGAKGFRKRELVITTDEQYPQSISNRVCTRQNRIIRQISSR